MIINHKSKILARLEVENIIKLLPLDYQTMDVVVKVIDRPIQYLDSLDYKTIKPNVILTLLHEIRHAYQDLVLNFDYETEYLDRWEEKDASEFSQTFFNDNKYEIKKITDAPFSCEFKINKKLGEWILQLEKENEEIIKVNINYDDIA